jgi:uncharacterized protein (DUF885 family)
VIRRGGLASLLLALLLLGAAGCKPETEVGDAEGGAPRGWEALVAGFLEQTFRAQPSFAVWAGRHEFDGQLPDWSTAGIEREIARLREARAEVEAFPAASLSAEQRFEREYLSSVIDGSLFWLDAARAPFRNPTWYSDQLDPAVYLSRPYAPLEVRMAGYIGYARAIPAAAANVRANLRTPLPRTFVDRAVGAFGGYAEFYRRDVPALFADVHDPRLQAELAEANAAAAAAMEGLRDWFEAQREHASDDFALGEELFARMLRATEGVDVALADLEAAGRADLARNQGALREACAQLLPGATVRACIDRIASEKPEEGAVARARAQLADLRAFVIAKDVVGIPGQEEARVAEAPPYNRANSAYIDIPGPYDGGLPSTYYVAPPDPAWSEAERAAYVPGEADLLFTSVHEVWPGHFLQFLHSNRNPSKIASLFVGYAFAEGWAHYTEEMMWEMGLGDGDPTLHIGELSNALLRNVRLLSAIGLHTRGMTVEESERLFLDGAYQDPGNARQQAARGTYDPAYLNYTLGKLMIRKLRSDWLARRPRAEGEGDPHAGWRAFHDAFLAHGGPPIPLLRRKLLGEDDAGPLL